MPQLPLLIILLVLTHVAFSGCRIAVALYAIHLQASPWTVGTLMATFAFLPALLSVSAGRWVDRVGITRPMLLGAVCLGLGVVLPFIFPSLSVLYVTSVVAGLSFMLLHVAAYQAVGAISPAQDLPVNFSYVALGFSTSAFIAPLLTGLCIDHLGYRSSFLVLAFFTVLPCAVLGAGLIPGLSAPRKPAHGDAPRGKLIDLLRDPPLRRLFTLMTVLTVSWDIYNFAMPVYGSHIGLSASQIGMVMGAFAAATFAVRMSLPFFAHRVEPWSLLCLSLLLAGLSFVAIPLASGVGTLMALMFVLGLGLGAPQPLMLTLLHQSAPPGRGGEAIGLRTTLIGISQTAMPLLFGAVSAALGMAPLFWVMAAALLGGSAYARRLRRTGN